MANSEKKHINLVGATSLNVPSRSRRKESKAKLSRSKGGAGIIKERGTSRGTR